MAIEFDDYIKIAALLKEEVDNLFQSAKLGTSGFLNAGRLGHINFTQVQKGRLRAQCDAAIKEIGKIISEFNV